MHEAGACIYVL